MFDSPRHCEQVTDVTGVAICNRFFGGSKPPPYSIGCTSLEIVGATIGRPCGTIFRFKFGYGEYAAAYYAGAYGMPPLQILHLQSYFIVVKCT